MRTLIPLSLLILTLVMAGVSARAQDTARTIGVTGVGAVSRAPDMATINVGIQSENNDAAFALDTTSRAVQAILTRLDAEGFDLADIRTGAIRLQPRYSNTVLSSGQQIIGYRAVNTVQVDVLELDQLGRLLSTLVADGANRLDRVSFGLQNPGAAIDEARQLAVADAMRRATLYAQAAGVTVGEVVSISEQGGHGYRAFDGEHVVMAEMARSVPSIDVPVAPGEIDLTASINMVFAIAQN